eukprot:11241287-Karenia_brevis.AAC.1
MFPSGVPAPSCSGSKHFRIVSASSSRPTASANFGRDSSKTIGRSFLPVGVSSLGPQSMGTANPHVHRPVV